MERLLGASQFGKGLLLGVFVGTFLFVSAPAQGQDLLAPRPAMPAVVHWGEAFEVILRSSKKLMQLGSPADWQVQLTTRAKAPWGEDVGIAVDLRFPLKVERVTKGTDGSIRLLVKSGYEAPRDTYHLEIMGPKGFSVTGIYSVRILGAFAHDELRVAVIADHQLRDPSVKLGGGDLNNGAYPHNGKTGPESIMLQETSELSFLDPDLILHLGDLVFGTDYRSEFRQTLELWWRKPLASLMVPGNHDGMALYGLNLKPDWYKSALHSLKCANRAFSKELDAYQVFSLLLCVFGDLKKMLFEDLQQDGLEFWKKYLGPENYSVTVDGVRFIGLNSYSGSTQRRHGFALHFNAFGLDLDLGTAVDNYGGFITPKVIAWLKDEIADAKKRRQKVVLFLHHDPRGNEDSSWGDAYHPNLPFPTEPLGLRKFQEWNFEGDPDWDSDPDDGVSGETQRSNSAVRLLELIASGVDLVLMGHAHVDRDKIYKAGDELVPGSGIRARHELRFTRVTTAAAHPGDADGYWGYRLAKLSYRAIDGLSWRGKEGLASVPAGNLWIENLGIERRGRSLRASSERLLYVVHNALPQPVTGVLRACLDASVTGWSFAASTGKLSLQDIGTGSKGRDVYYLRASVPACKSKRFPPAVGTESVSRITVRRALGNHVPDVKISSSTRTPGVAQEVQFDASMSKDPDGDPIILYKWDFGDGYSNRGEKVSHAFGHTGKYLVKLTAVDSHGAYASYSKTIWVKAGLSCSSSDKGQFPGLVLGLLLAALLGLRKARNR